MTPKNATPSDIELFDDLTKVQYLLWQIAGAVELGDYLNKSKRHKIMESIRLAGVLIEKHSDIPSIS